MTLAATSGDEQFDIRQGMPALVFRVFVVFGILAALSLAILVAGKMYGRSLMRAGHSSSLQRYEITIGNDALAVSANMIRKEEQRHTGLQQRLDLYVHWPTLSGFRDNLSPAFNDVNPATNSIVFISLVPRATTRDMAGRFGPVYENVMEGTATDLGNGLKSATLSPEAGYVNERIVFSGPQGKDGRRFVARCQDAGATAHVILAPCETDIHIGDMLSAQIRFPSHLLKDWRQLHASLPAFLNGLLVRDPG